MAITFVAATSSASGQNNNPPLPSGLQEGDLVLAGSGSDNTQASVPTGWTGLNKGANQSVAPDGNTDSRGLLCYKVMGPTPDTTFPINTGNQNWVCAAFRGVDVDNAGFINHTSAIVTNNGGMPNPPPVTPNDTSRDNWVVAWGMLDDDERTDVTAGANYTLIGSGALGGDGTTMAAYRANITATEDPPQFGGGGTDEWDSYSVVLKPALANPTITDVDTDETIGVTQTNVVITGTIFQSPQGTGKVEISPNNTYAAGGLVLQSIDSWADTSIQFDVVRTGLSAGTNYIWVTNNGGNQNDTAFPITLVGNTPTITDVDGDNALTVGQTNIVLGGTNFESVQGTGKLEISANASYGSGLVLQSIDSWSNTSIQFDLNRTGLSVGTLYLYVTNNDGVVSAARPFTLNAPVPTITSFNGGSAFFADDTGIALVGTNFQNTDTGLAKVELGNATTYASSATKVELNVTSWSDTSLTVDGGRGALSTGTVYVYVTNLDGGLNSSGFAATLSSVVPSVTSLDGDGGAENADITVGDTGIILTGSNFRANQGTGKLEVVNNSSYASATVKNTQTVTSWSGSSITFNLDNSAGLSEGTNYVFVTNATGEVS
jgi:hypothetical protein